MSNHEDTITESDIFDADKEAYFAGHFDSFWADQSEHEVDGAADWPTDSEIDYWDADFEDRYVHRD